MDKCTFLRTALRQKRPALGTWLTLPGTAVARTIASVPGLQWILIDAEHGQITDRDYYELNNAIVSHGVSPIIRIPFADGWLIKRAIDSGAHGIMVPMIHTAELAASVVSLSKFGPQGARGYGSPFTHHAFGVDAREYELTCNEHLLTILQIESQQGLDNIEAIAAVPGVDVIFIGPFDLAKSMNVEFGGEQHESAIAKVLKATKAAGKYASIFCLNGEQARKRLEQGFDMASVATDTASLTRDLTLQLKAINA
ncbi:Phosphoenolpyruvate/pyruvate domain-containing protein [Rhodotorula sp. JG-1b]|nr:Phosphoenolpyruvate/pyruvate domain-containing protein [Rhodotorula sp. JG-1b]